MRIFRKKEKEITIQALLKCPDGLCESLGYDLPSQIDDFIKFINKYSKKKEYTIKLERFYLLEALAKMRNKL